MREAEILFRRVAVDSVPQDKEKAHYPKIFFSFAVHSRYGAPKMSSVLFRMVSQ